MTEPRTGAALIRASNPYAVEDRAVTWRLLIETFLVYGVLQGLILLTPWWPVQVLISCVIGLVVVRLFIFFHDWSHGAIFNKSTGGRICMAFVGTMVLTAPSVWKQTHDYHHQNNAKMVGASIGSYPLITVEMYRNLKPVERWFYGFARHPLTMFFAYFTLFCIGMVLSPFRRDPSGHRQAPMLAAAHFVILFTLGWFAGPWIAFLTWFVPSFVSTAVGAYLFYAQHNFPTINLRNRVDWEYTYAALNSSSFFDMSPVMHWLTGNIGYHHVHHLNHRIPFYRLPEAMAEIPELQRPGRTTWWPRDVLACLRIKLWDPQAGRMVTFKEAASI